MSELKYEVVRKEITYKNDKGTMLGLIFNNGKMIQDLMLDKEIPVREGSEVEFLKCAEERMSRYMEEHDTPIQSDEEWHKAIEEYKTTDLNKEGK